MADCSLGMGSARNMEDLTHAVHTQGLQIAWWGGLRILLKAGQVHRAASLPHWPVTGRWPRSVLPAGVLPGFCGGR